MSARKRDRDADIQIKVAEGEPLQAEAVILRAFSACAKALPADTDVWDLSNFIYSSGSSSSSSREPFSHKAVKCWLGCVYSCLNDPATELDAEDVEQLSTAEGLHQVLSFAHAVGSRDAVLRAACSHLDDMQFVVQLSDQRVRVPAAPHGVLFFDDDDRLYCKSASDVHDVGSTIESKEQGDELRHQLAAQVAALLHLAHVLNLRRLFDVLRNFMFWATSDNHNSLLGGVLNSVFTEAVLTAALGNNSSLTKDAYTSSMLVRPGGHVLSGSSALFKRVGSVKGTDGVQQFRAHMLQDFAGVKAGEEVTVKLWLLHDEPQVRIQTSDEEGVWITAQVLLGRQPVSAQD